MAIRTLTLIKSGHKYALKYSPGHEREIIDQLAKLAEDNQSGVNWVDAATLSFHVARNTANDCSKLLRDKYRQAS